MRAFNRVHPGVRIQIYEMTPPEQEEALRSGEIDLALIGDPPTPVRRDFRVEMIRKTEQAMVVPDTHGLAGRRSVDLAEFGADVFVTLHEEQFPGRPEMLAEMFCQAGIKPVVSLKARGLSELLGLVGGGMGVAIAPADLVEMPHAGVVFLKLRKPKRTLKFSAAWREGCEEVEELVGLMKGVVG